ncbi:MAG: Fn3-like domain-containing protein [Pseudomonadota bacterium]
MTSQAARWAFALLTLFASTAMHAQSLILRPAVVPLAGQPGQGVTQELTLQNESDTALDFRLEAQDVIVRNGARVFVEAGKLADSIAASAAFTPRQVTVPAHSSVRVSVTFTLPAAVQHRAVIAVFRGTSKVRTGSGNATLSLGTLFTFSLSDRVSVAAQPLQARPPTAQSMLVLAAHMVNNGSEPVVPTGMAVLLDASGRMVGKSAFKPHRLLPGEAGDLRADYAGDLPTGAYRAIATFDIAGKPLTLDGTLQVP